MKKLKKMCVVLMIFVFAFSLLSCTSQKEETKETISLYFTGKDSTSLVYEEFDIVNSKSKEESVRLAMEALLLGPKNKENSRVIRDGTKLISAKVDSEGKAEVNFSKEFYNSSNIYNILAASSIVKSICSIKGVNKVIILVENMPLISPGGEEMGYLSENDLVFDITATEENEVNVRLYFSDNEAMYFVKEMRKINVPTGESVEKLIVSELIKGPTKEKAMKIIPAETKIRSVETKDGVCFVNLSSEFITKHSGGSSTEYMTIYSIVNSLTELSHIEKVQFLIEGEKKDTLVHFTLNEPFERDEAMIK